MFDWTDEELANIIWGETGENDDHIVPYPDGSEEKPTGSYGDQNMEWNQEAANVKLTEQKKPIVTTESHGGKVGSNSQYDTYGGVPASGLSSWPDLSLSNAAKPDDDHMDGTAKIDDGSQNFENQPKDREEGDFVDYGWASIGSFDDLDRILSNNDPMFGHVNLGNADELWSSSKDVTSSPERSVSLSLDPPRLGLGVIRSKSDHVEAKAKYMLDEKRPNPGLQKFNDYSSHSPQDVKASLDNLDYGGCESKYILKYKAASDAINALNIAMQHESTIDKVTRQRKLLNSQNRTSKKGEARNLQTFCGPWSSFGDRYKQFVGQYAQQMGQTSSSQVISPGRQSLGSESSQYKHFTNPLLAPSGYKTMGNQYPAIPALSQFHSGEGQLQQVPSEYEVPTSNSNPLNKSLDAQVKSLNMTPQEKIEKLRRRQQMRAMVAIRKQQQKFSHQVSHNECSLSPRYSHENQMQIMEGGNIEVDENLSTLLSLDPSSPVEQNDSNTASMTIDKNTVEDTILFQLQDVIENLDIQIRLCIRDSLFRLAQSSMQRQYASNTSSTNKTSIDVLNVLMEEGIDSNRRVARMPDVETQTNPIDRTVAHLLFHRPLELSQKPPESLQSPLYRKTAKKEFFTEGYKDNQSTNITCLFAEGNESR